MTDREPTLAEQIAGLEIARAACVAQGLNPKDIDAILASLRRLQVIEQDGWIKCSERLPAEAAVAEMISDMPYFVESKHLNLKKIKLPDGREALIQVHVTCDEQELEWYENDWRPLPPLPRSE